MNQFQVLVTEPIVEEPLQKLKNHYAVTVGKPGEFTEEKPMIEAAGRYDALLTMLSNPVSQAVLEAGRNRLKIVANYAVGYNNIDIDAAEKLNIHVSNTPDVLTDSTAEIALALLLGTARQIPGAETSLRNNRFHGWEPTGYLGLELHGAKLGIVGLGRIGQALAERAKACGMEIWYHNRTRANREVEERLDANYLPDLHELLSNVDALSLHCPLTEETHHLIGKRELEMMQNHALIINTSRGPVIDEESLAEALHNSKIGGAGLDVYEEEPRVHPDLLTAPNTILLPHIGSATKKSRTAMGNLAVQAIQSVLNGRRAPNLIV